MSIYGFVIAKLLLKTGYPIKGFFDNNNKYYRSRILGLKVISPLILKKKSKKKLSKIFVIISSQGKTIKQSILAQLKKSGLKKVQVISKNFHSLL